MPKSDGFDLREAGVTHLHGLGFVDPDKDDTLHYIELRRGTTVRVFIVQQEDRSYEVPHHAKK